nr:transposase [Ardenticatena maritima]
MLFWDEMRVGGLDQIRHRWAPRGMKLVQKVAMRFEWVYLVLAVAPGRGEIWWTWIPTMGAESHKKALEAAAQATGMEAVIWDRAPGHRAKALAGVAVRRIYLPLTRRS